MSAAIDRIKNFYGAPTVAGQRYAPSKNPNDFLQTNLPGQQPNKKTPIFPITRVQFERIRTDIAEWRAAIIEAENAYNPNRVKMQRIYQDTIINEHVKACIVKRKALTLQRKFKMCDVEGNKDEETTKIFITTWFRQFQSYALDAILNGYNLISLGDIINDSFPNLSFVRRQNINVDRLIVTNLVYSLSGPRFDEPPYQDYFIYAKTPSDTGVSPCGYGLLYNIARAEIFLRNNTGQNADYNETFGQPVRMGKTAKQDAERSLFESALANMGSNAWILLDEGMDTLELLESSGSGRAFETYKDFEKRMEAKISKILLGHADAMDSTPGKLGGTQDAEESPVNKALDTTQNEDAEFLQPLINLELIPRMIKMGFNIPTNLHFEYLNDEEKEAFRRREDDSNQKTATVVKTIKDAGGDITDETWKWFEDRTGIPGIKVPAPPPAPIMMPGMPGMKPGLPGQKQSPDQIAAAKNYMEAILNFDESRHPRIPAGGEHGGEWASTPKGGNKVLAEHFKRAEKLAKENGGFSLMPKNLSDIKAENYIVALGGYEYQVPFKKFSYDDINKYYYDHLSQFKKEDNLILGGWHNKDNDVMYLDISKAFKSKAEAIKFGKISNQLKGWDAKLGKEFDITSKMKNSLTAEQQSAKLKAMFSNRIENVPLGEDDDGSITNLWYNFATNTFEEVPRVPAGSSEGGQWTSGAATTEAEAIKMMQPYRAKIEGDMNSYVAIKQYTSTTYYEMNRSLRENLELDPVLQKQSQYLDKIVAEAPKYKGEVYRGMQFRDLKSYEQFKEQVQVNSVLKDKGYMSTSLDTDSATLFLYGSDYVVKVNIKSKNGVYLNGLSTEQTEKEVLFGRNSKFKVTGIKETNDYKFGLKGIFKKHLLLSLEEI